MSVKSFLTKPVAWLTTVSAALGTATTAEIALTATPVHLPAWVAGYTAAATVIVTAVLGVLTYKRVTPVAAPRDNAGRPLVPARTSSA